MRLYIAEKPSMGAEIAKCLKGPVRRRDGYLETGEGIVTWAFGHILHQAEPEEYDEKYGKWRAEDLPIVPKAWQLVVAKSSEKQFHLIASLIERADEIVHAGDPDREGQLLIDEILDYLRNERPVKRLLLNALDETSIRKALASMQDNAVYRPLKQSALARARADWLIGMNLSRAFTLAAQRGGHAKLVLPIGRVKTPTLALVVRREREIENFKSVSHYGIKAAFQAEHGSFSAIWKFGEDTPGLDAEGRLLDIAYAKERLAEFAAHRETAGKITLYQRAKKEEPQRLPFSLSSLQVLAGKRYGLEPQQVLDAAQTLYEKKLTTYPRSDSEYLPESQKSDAPAILVHLAAVDGELGAWAQGADASIRSRAWNDKKITAHHAIIPTRVKPALEKLTDTERKLYFLIAQAYIAQFYPVHRYEQTKIEVTYLDEVFRASGRTEVDLGWRALYQKNANPQKTKDAEDGAEESVEEDETALPPLKKGAAVHYADGALQEKATKPPTRFTPSTLLQGMKEIHKYVRDEAAKKKLKAVYGIGTEATRASIIEDLIRRKFLRTKGKKKELYPTETGYLLVDALPEELLYPDTTAVWEDALHSMAEGEGDVDTFLQGQVALLTSIVGKAAEEVIRAADGVLCPRCKKGMLERRDGKHGAFWGCTNFPKCRMTAPDADGKPDLHARRVAANTSFIATAYDGAESGARAAKGAPPPGSAYAASPYLTEEEMAAFAAEYMQDTMFAQTAYPKKRTAAGAATYAPKPPAAIRERGIGQDSGHICPKCKEGRLRRIEGRNGAFWGCNRYPRCTATYDDAEGKPKLT